MGAAMTLFSQSTVNRCSYRVTGVSIGQGDIAEEEQDVVSDEDVDEGPGF